MKIRIVLIMALLLNCGCAHLTEVKEPLCENRLEPYYEGYNLKVDGEDAMFNGKIKNLLSGFKDSKEDYENSENNETTAIVTEVSGGILGVGGLLFFMGSLAGAAMESSPNNNLSDILWGSLISVGISIVLLVFGSWKAHDAGNDLLKGIYEYKNDCMCLKDGKNPAEDFYYPQEPFFGVVDFVGLRNGERFSYNSSRAEAVFSKVKGYRQSLDLISSNELGGRLSVLGDTALFTGGILLRNQYMEGIALCAYLPVVLLLPSLHSNSMNEAFSLVGNLNTGTLVDDINKRGIDACNSGDYQEAIMDYDKAISLDRNRADIYNNRGIAENNADEHDEAIKDYDKAILLDPDNGGTYYNRAHAKFQSGDKKGAIEDLNKAGELGYKQAYDEIKDIQSK